jgi:hypothetical protein
MSTTEIDLNAKEVITDIKATIALKFEQIRFGKDNKSSIENMIKFKSIVDSLKNGEVSENIQVFNSDDDVDNNDTFQCKLDFDKILELEKINIDNSLSKVLGEWCYTFSVYLDLSADNVDAFLTKVSEIDLLFKPFYCLENYPEFHHIYMSKYSGMVDKKSVKESVEGDFFNTIEFSSFVEAYE